MTNDAIPFYEDGDELTCTATAAVTGKTFVVISGDRQADGTLSVAPCGDNGRAFGVAMWNAAIGQRVTVHRIEGHNVMPVTQTNAALAAGALVASAAGGLARVAAAGEHVLGTTVNGSPANADAQVALGRQTA
jgi:predicted RecA/RadA family phage recombinase